MHSRPSLRPASSRSERSLSIQPATGRTATRPTGDCDDGNGACTLRAAIQQTNAGVGGIIEFEIAGAGPHTIQPASALPTISKSVFLDGLSQPGASVSSIRIELDGTNAGTTTNGLTVAAADSWIRGLAINRFAAAGIVVQTGGRSGDRAQPDRYESRRRDGPGQRRSWRLDCWGGARADQEQRDLRQRLTRGQRLGERRAGNARDRQRDRGGRQRDGRSGQ